MVCPRCRKVRAPVVLDLGQSACARRSEKLAHYIFRPRVRCAREALPAKNSFMVTDAKLVENLFEQGERLVSSACAPLARTIGCVTVSAQLALNQCPMFRFSRRTTRPPRYLAMSTAGISFRLA